VDELERLAGKFEQQLAPLVLENRPQLHEVDDQPAQTGGGWQPSVGERHRHPRALVGDPELTANRPRRASIEHVGVDVGLVAVGREEPRLDRPVAAHALDPTAALSEPDVAQASPEEAALALPLGNDPERAEALIDDLGVEALAVVGADELVAPGSERGQPEAAKGGLPRLQELWIRGPDSQLDAAALTSGSVDCRVRVCHELGDDLREIDPSLREVLAEVSSTNPTVAQLRSVDRHG
jgi:hypothetical protein